MSVRTHKCPECGLVLDRDHVSAMIIKNKPTIKKESKKLSKIRRPKKELAPDTGQRNIDQFWS